MNVNPFSYLTERIKNKVDKNEVYIDSSVDLNNCTDTYTLYYCTGASVPINAPTAGAYNFLVWNETHGNYSCQFYFSYNANKIFWRKREVNSWGSWNELALTSDYGAKTVVETRHDIVFNNSDTSNWIDPPSAISSKTIYAMVFSSLDGGGGLVTREAGGSNRFAIRWSVAITTTLSARLVWFYTD